MIEILFQGLECTEMPFFFKLFQLPAYFTYSHFSLKKTTMTALSLIAPACWGVERLPFCNWTSLEAPLWSVTLAHLTVYP